ncbi:MAG: epoxyqueuosine reductase [Ruminococcus sp.]|nr:epoxyqueuosine reductase [Candidatus Copronaster equi]
MIEDIISEFSSEFGFCSFSQIENSLIDCRAKSRIPENAKSVIVMLFPYYFGKNAYTNSNISKYACVKDYHIVISDILSKIVINLKDKFPDNSFVGFCDNSPVPEVKAAVLAGLGARGKNGLLINKIFGSFVFIGEIITDLLIQSETINPVECLNCNLCVEACPSGAISDKGVEKPLCLSDITQRKGDLSEKEINLISDSTCIWGCDICQDVCPLNKNITISPVEQFKNGFEAFIRTDGDISDRAYAWRGKKILQRNISILERNDEK